LNSDGASIRNVRRETWKARSGNQLAAIKKGLRRLSKLYRSPSLVVPIRKKALMVIFQFI
jgi:hypothetical protein